jgi:hypothetical protein
MEVEKNVRTESESALTFALLDKRIEELPVGPVKQQVPPLIRLATLIGFVGCFLAFLPSLMVNWLEPQQWMVNVARQGFVLTLVGFAPGFLHNVWLLVRELRNHRHSFLAQFDHDVEEFKRLAEWLSIYPRDVLETNLRYARMGRERLHARIALLLGGVERLGLLPTVVALWGFMSKWEEVLSLPYWLIGLGLFAPLLWLIGSAGAEFGRRLDLYAFVLEEGLRRKAD